MIRGKHGEGEIHDDDQCIFAFLHRLRELIPDRSRHGDDGEAPGCQQQQQRRALGCILAAIQQEGQQGLVDGLVPGGYHGIHPPQGDDEDKCGQQGQQPQGAQEMEVIQQVRGNQQLHQALPPWGKGSSDLSSSSKSSTRALPASDSQGMENSAKIKLMRMAAPRGQ